MRDGQRRKKNARNRNRYFSWKLIKLRRRRFKIYFFGKGRINSYHLGNWFWLLDANYFSWKHKRLWDFLQLWSSPQSDNWGPKKRQAASSSRLSSFFQRKNAAKNFHSSPANRQSSSIFRRCQKSSSKFNPNHNSARSCWTICFQLFLLS